MKFAHTYEIPQEIVSVVETLLIDCKNISEIPLQHIESLRSEFMQYLNTTTALNSLNDEDGIISFHFKQNDASPFEGQIILSSAMFHLVNTSLYCPTPEAKNQMPYTTYKSTAKNADKMKAAGVKFYTPDEKLGYHNDVFHRNGEYFIPKYVSLMNLFIGYKEPGNFYYINQNTWKDFDDIFLKGVGSKFKFRPTPIVYESYLNDTSSTHVEHDWIDIPAFWESKSGQRHAFSNGELQDNNDTNIIGIMKKSLSDNPDKIAIPQRTNQIMVFRNDTGFHSRDIFQEQQIFEGTTRLFLRAVSEEYVTLPQQQ